MVTSSRRGCDAGEFAATRANAVAKKGATTLRNRSFTLSQDWNYYDS